MPSQLWRVDEIPIGYCQCGCGQKTRIAPANHAKYGHVKGQPQRYVKNHHGRKVDLTRYEVVDRGYTTPCWVWQGALVPDGYGQAGRGKRAHRLTYEALVGPIPAHLQLDHLCRVRACVNPEHLEPVTSRENTLRSDGLAAINARKTHCLNGHPLAGDNLVLIDGGTKRRCRTCSNARDRARRRARKAQGRTQ